MKLQIPISELTSLVKVKSNKQVALKIIDEKTIEVGYDVKMRVPLLGELSKNVVIDLTYEKLVGETLYLTYSATGIGVDLILKGILAALPTFSSQQLIESCANNSLIIHLDEIEQVHSALQQTEINDIVFKNDMVIVDFKVKA